MSDEYTPTTEDVRNDYCEARWEGFPHVSAEHYGEKFGAEFDRWLQAHDREVAEKAWDEGWKQGSPMADSPRIENPYREGATE